MDGHPIKRDADGRVIESCPARSGVLIGSYDCTANCPNNQNTKKELHKHAFDLPFVSCSEIKQEKQQQLTFEI